MIQVRFCSPFRQCVSLVGLLTLLVFPLSAPAQDATVIGAIGGLRITSMDVEAHLSRTGGPRPGESAEEARSRAADELLAGLVLEARISEAGEIDSQLGAAIASSRRQLIIGH